MQVNNDLKKMETTLIEGMMKAYAADFGRSLSTAEHVDRKKTFAWLKAELKSRKRTSSNLLPENKA